MLKHLAYASSIRYFLFILYLHLGCHQNQYSEARKKLIFNGLLPSVLQDTPGKKGKKIAEISAGEILHDLGENSAFISTIALRDTIFHAPWIFVENSKGKRGWVFAAALNPQKGDAAQWQRGKLMDTFWGHELTLRIQGWANALHNSERDTDFAINFKEGINLRDTLVRCLLHRSEPGETALEESYFLVKDALPGYIMQRMEFTNLPYYFADYPYFMKIAAQTLGDEDDHFISISMRVFARDSIESIFPDWILPLESDRMASLLGSGKYLDILKLLKKTDIQNSPFWEDYEQLLQKMLENLLAGDTIFWYSRKAAAAELRQILEQNFPFINATDQMALSTRLQELESNAASSHQFDARAMGWK